jgi:hypothetical protein
MAALVGALGAAQLAVIASTSYQGGSSTASTNPGKVSLGERSSTVDLAKSGSAAGELSYLRGERGVGGPNDFVPTFTGRSRMAGGSVGMIVGEQGPELIVPDRPAKVIPADETQNIGAPVNVSFSINAIDARGVDDLLSARRGHIIQMIREAANSNGEFFLEGVNTLADEAQR